jgi:hypothetical protein
MIPSLFSRRAFNGILEISIPMDGDRTQERRKVLTRTATAAPSPNKQQATRFVEAILAEPTVPQRNPDELHCVFNKVPHPVFTSTLVDIVIRHQDHNFWDVCISELEDPVETRRRLVSIGSPGIGKSITALFLIRKLLLMEKIVVYRMKDEGLILHFILNRDEKTGANDIDVEVFSETTPEWEIASLLNGETYYIVDPGMTKENCDPPRRVSA